MSSSVTPVQAPSGFLVDLIPVHRRKQAYALYGLFAFVVSVVFLAVLAYSNGSVPPWLAVATVVSNALAVPFSALATSNARETTTQETTVSETPPEIDNSLIDDASDEQSPADIVDLPDGETEPEWDGESEK